ncbi:hypothetical protein CRG98_017287 [Punica granatum]|uniref:Uncharacterized protein n=1 Tax=Punica granatum TaxID=22663 RepID=A0A2I0K3K1_PUNGR|nr:hypothetical protein CRG98_017287 [Punica granatum]
MQLPAKIKVPEFQRYYGTTDPHHHLRHYRGKMLQYWDYEEFVIHTFQDSLAGAALDWRGKETSVNAVNSVHQAPQQYSISYTPAPQATQAYASPSMHYQQQLPTQQVYYSAPPASFPSPVLQQYAHNYAPAPPPIQQSRPPASRTPQPVQRAPAPQDQQGIATQMRRKQFTPLLAPLSHIYRQLLSGNKIRSIAPNPDFDPTI